MLRSMYSGISGMKNFQIKLDVIGNNIANVNTYGYKKGRTTFKDMVSQSISGSSAPGDTRGGVNPKQVGLGSQLSTIDMIDTQGSLQTTGRPLDLGISGDGFFVVAEGAVNAGNPPTVNITFSTAKLTRAGNFYLDKNGFLVNGDGYYVLDTEGNAIQIPIDAESFSIGSDGSINVVGATYSGKEIALVKVPNPSGLEKVGSNLYAITFNSGTTDNDEILEQADLLTPGTKGAGTIVSGTLEMSNVDLSEEFTEMIVAQRGFQANTRIITTSDEILQELVNLKR
ncbi:flagellar basal body rod protein FlgG [Calidifontibacillus erzurumensis]|uniref:Flagellar hook protein FlgE n=1 Tax=Calidifontibacillus erzurumensis TaxID=2741433 RepID=A0A8J8GG56_9BACI|nr:flagellar basal body rod protein FlgG [Calidifontibacillus erzurumensis]NSL51178.1 flagellar basal body rod protein FlgG [Calidifontibacillus erzurumensis]